MGWSLGWFCLVAVDLCGVQWKAGSIVGGFFLLALL